MRVEPFLSNLRVPDKLVEGALCSERLQGGACTWRARRASANHERDNENEFAFYHLDALNILDRIAEDVTD
jgi:hypothetical protein